MSETLFFNRTLNNVDENETNVHQKISKKTQHKKPQNTTLSEPKWSYPVHQNEYSLKTL